MSNTFVITGPSGAGKTTVAHALLERRPSLRKVVTCTTRPPREGERDGVDYHFLDPDTFRRHIEADEMFEWANVYDRYYGSRRSDVDALLAAGFDVLFVTDIQGARNIASGHPKALLIFIDAESTDELLSRLEARDNGRTANLDQRRAAIEEERSFASACDLIVINHHGKLEETVREVEAFMERRG